MRDLMSKTAKVRRNVNSVLMWHMRTHHAANLPLVQKLKGQMSDVLWDARGMPWQHRFSGRSAASAYAESTWVQACHAQVHQEHMWEKHVRSVI